MHAEFAVVLAELSDVVPRRVQELPNVLVIVRKLPKRGDLLKSLQKHKFYGGFIKRLSQDVALLPRFEDIDAAKKHRNELAQTLASLGYTVNPQLEHPRHVYVLELDARKIGLKSDLALYVGETYLSTQERTKNHLNGYKASSKVKRAFVRHRPELEPHSTLYSVWDSKAEEKAWAAKLRSDGYHVISS